MDIPQDDLTGMGQGRDNIEELSDPGAPVGSTANKMTEATILDLLARKHAKDLFVPHCKTGPTQFAPRGELSILDAWAMRRSWTNMTTFGYEIKVSRQDFLTDNKWENYLNYCNDFYFVCPSGIILPTELPPEAGLYYVSKTGTKLFKKKKCVRRDLGVPQFLLYYILMSRTKIVKERVSFSPKTYRDIWLENKRINIMLGNLVGKKIRQTIKDRIEDVENKNADLQKKNECLQRKNECLLNVKKLLEQWGLNIDHLSSWDIEYILKEKMRLVEKGIPRGLMGFLDDSIEGLKRVKKIFQDNGGISINHNGLDE